MKNGLLKIALEGFDDGGQWVGFDFVSYFIDH